MYLSQISIFFPQLLTDEACTGLTTSPELTPHMFPSRLRKDQIWA